MYRYNYHVSTRLTSAFLQQPLSPVDDTRTVAATYSPTALLLTAASDLSSPI